MLGSWICLLLVVCRCFEGLVTPPLSLPPGICSLSLENVFRNMLVTKCNKFALEHLFSIFIPTERERERTCKST